MPLLQKHVEDVVQPIKRIKDFLDASTPWKEKPEYQPHRSANRSTKRHRLYDLDYYLSVAQDYLSKSTNTVEYAHHLIAIISQLFTLIRGGVDGSQFSRYYAEEFNSNIVEFITSLRLEEVSTNGLSTPSTAENNVHIFLFVAYLLYNKDLLNLSSRNRLQILENASQSVYSSLTLALLNNPTGTAAELFKFFPTKITLESEAASESCLDFMDQLEDTKSHDIMQAILCFSLADAVGIREYTHTLNGFSLERDTSTPNRNKLLSLDFKKTLLALSSDYPQILNTLIKGAIDSRKTLAPSYTSNRIYRFLKYVVFNNDETTFIEFMLKHADNTLQIDDSDSSAIIDDYNTLLQRHHQRKMVKEEIAPLKADIEGLVNKVKTLEGRLRAEEGETHATRGQSLFECNLM
jgi:hypothetical protein